MAVDRNAKSGQSVRIRKRTPLEQAIAEKTDPRARYDARMRRSGFKKTTIWVRSDCLDQVKAFVQALNDAAPQGPCHD